MGKTPPRGDSSYWDKEKKTHNVWVSIADISANENGVIRDSKEYISNKAAKNIKLVSPDSLLVSFKLSIGKMAFTGVPLYTNEAIISLPPREDISLEYLHKYFLYFDWDKACSGDVKVKGKTLNKEKLKDIDVLVPPLSEQKRIVKFLDEEFSKIETLKTNAETNLKKAGAIFDTELKKEFNNKKWDSKKLNDLCELISGYAFDSKGYSSKNEDTLLVCGDNIMHCSFRWETVKRWPKEKCYELKRFELKDSDIVLAMDRPWIKSGLKISKITGNELPSLLVQRTAALRTTSHVSSDYLYYALQEKKFSDYLIDQQTGSGVPHISGKQILNFQIPLPPLSVQKEIVVRLDKLSENVKRLEANYKQIIANCDELKKSILKKTFEGDSRSSRE